MSNQYRAFFSIDKQSQLISGYSIPVVDELLAGPDSFIVDMSCMTREQQHGLDATPYIEKKTVHGFEFVYATKYSNKIICKSLKGSNESLCDLDDKSPRIMQIIHNIVKNRLNDLPDFMREVYMAIVDLKYNHYAREFVLMYYWAHELIDDLNTFFLVDARGPTSVIIPRKKDKDKMPVPKLTHKDREMKIEIQSRLREAHNYRNPLMMTHTTLMECEDFYFNAYNDIFLEKAEDNNILAINAPNTFDELRHKLYPETSKYDRAIMHPFLPILYVNKISETNCDNCGKITDKICETCKWARKCISCESHNLCKNLEMLRSKIAPI